MSLFYAYLLNLSHSKLQVQRPGIEPIIYRDLFLFRTLASFLNGISLQKLGCNAELIVDEFGEKLLEELDYTLVSLFFVPFFCRYQSYHNNQFCITTFFFLCTGVLLPFMSNEDARGVLFQQQFLCFIVYFGDECMDVS